MKVICAPDKFKGSLTASEAAIAMERGVLRACPVAVVDCCPIADGGEGFLQTLHDATGGEWWEAEVCGPLPDEPAIRAKWLMLGDARRPRASAVEMSRASGLQLLTPGQRNPLATTTFGTGQLIAAASRMKKIVVGIGGSATTDGGAGAAQAMGVRFFDCLGSLIKDPMTGGKLLDISRIDAKSARDHGIRHEITVACDVANPLTGPNGAACVYAPQKGATPEQVAMLDHGLRHLSRLVREQLGLDYDDIPGAGAAGGLGFGLMAFLGARLVPGIELVLDTVRFAQRVHGCDLCLTGEGRLDGQSLSGKACIGVARAAGLSGVPTVALVGAAAPDADRAIAAGLSSYHVIGEGLPADASMTRAAELVEAAAYRVVCERM